MASPLEGLNNDFKSSLKGMGIYVVDVETTGLEKSDKMYSAAHTSFDLDPNSSSTTKESFFKLKSTDVDRKFYSTDENHLNAIQQNLQKKHSSKSFGNKQLKGGSLKGYAESLEKGSDTSPANFLKELDDKVSSHTQGSVILSHNSNFENDTFNNLKGSSKEYDSVFNQLQARNNLNKEGIFATNPKLSTNTRVSDLKGLSQKAGTFYNESIVTAAKAKDPTLIRKALGEYASMNVDIVNEIHDQISSGRLKAGQYTSIDSMHLSRALMSFGALNGDVSVGNLVAGDKVEHQAMSFLKEAEKHTAGSDADQQARIAKKLFNELDEFKKDPKYKSKLLQEYDKYLTDNNAASKSFKNSLVNETMTLTSKTDSEKLVKMHEFFDKSLDRYSIATGDHERRKEFHRKLKIELDLHIKDSNTTIKDVKESIQKFSDEFDMKAPKNSTQVKTSKAMSESLMEGLKNHKKIVAGVGAALGASLFIGGGEKGKDKKYNTYDELYNSQYYGTGFADWQERNGAHKVLY